MNKKADIWMPLYIGDYLADTARLTTEQHGAYLLLLMDYWRSGKLPDNDQVLAQITKMTPDAWSNAKAMLMQYFSIEQGYWVHKRVEQEILDAAENKDKKHQRAVKAADARWKKSKNDATSNANAMLKECPSPSPSPVLNTIVGAKAPKAKRLDMEYLPQEWAMFCINERPDLEPSPVWNQFKDYWAGVSGSKGTKLDWFATWRNWVRNQKAPIKVKSDKMKNFWDQVDALPQLEIKK
jgi:uncharacterized protein YdaU (DUF1376 family)